MSDNCLQELRKFVAPEFVFGPGASDLAVRYAMNFEAGRILLVTDPGVRDAGWAGKVRDALRDAGLEVVVYDNVSPNPRDFEVMTGAEIYLANLI